MESKSLNFREQIETLGVTAGTRCCVWSRVGDTVEQDGEVAPGVPLETLGTAAHPKAPKAQPPVGVSPSEG